MFIDEVLAVGDASFQRRCYDFIHDFVKSGKTTVFVSHNLYVIEQLCDRVAWMERGEVVKTGTPSQVLPAYLDNQDQKALAAAAKIEQMHASSSADDLSQASQLRFSSITFTDVNGVQKEAFQYGEDVVIQARYNASEPIPQPHFVFGLVDAEGGRPLFLASMLVDGHAPPLIQGEGVIKCVFRQVPLLPRAYYAWGEVWDADRAKALVRWQRLSGFRIVDNNKDEMSRGSIRHTRADAPIRVPYDWEY
jgi:Wzt C-terminal domain